MEKVIRIGTRNSELALWQAQLVQKSLRSLGYQGEIVEVSSTGDEILDIPLHQIGGMGLFTKTLDIAMLQGKIDIAVHSLKDVPTQLPDTIVQAAVLERAHVQDVLVYKDDLDFLEVTTGIVATGSLRRKAQWLNRYPTHTLTDLRGNVNTRLKKLKENNWNGAIFARAGLERIHLLPPEHLVLDWMIPAPAQGAIMITALDETKGNTAKSILQACAKLNHRETEITVAAERQFMRALEGGCTAPIGACATISRDKISFKGVLSALDGSSQIEVQKQVPLQNAFDLGTICAEEILKKGGTALMKKIKEEMKLS
jgi:hydroxymethylbilane synthase